MGDFIMASNFDFLTKYCPVPAQLGRTAELYLFANENSCITRLGALAERLIEKLCVLEDLKQPETCSEGLQRLKYAQKLPRRIEDMLYTLCKAAGEARFGLPTGREEAVALLQLAFHLSCWLAEVYLDPDFAAPEYILPEDSTSNPDFFSHLQAEEEKCAALSARNVEATAYTTEGESRKDIALRVAKALPLSPSETDCLSANPIRLDASVLPGVNFAMHQNGASIIHLLTIENTTDSIPENLELEIRSTPEFTLPFTRHIDLLPAHKAISVARPKLMLNGEFLAGMTEKLTGTLHMALRSGDTVLASDYREITVYAYDEWHGLGLYSELLSAFVTPNHPEIARILARATEFLGNWTGDTSMDAYQSRDPNRVLQQAAAIFTAIKEQAISYVVPPASFERMGQRVRLCDTVLQQKLGTCLDLTLLYASCLEAAGLHPLLLTTPGHIFTGLWLEDKMFPECVQDDVSLITKRLASGINEIAVVETTGVTTARDLSFDDARSLGERNLVTQQLDYIIDVYRARMSQISPLPQRVHTPSGWVVQHEVRFRRENMAAPTNLDTTIRLDPQVQEENLPKKVQWERKLLDLGLRNTLINLRLTKTQLPILTGSLDELENALADGSDFRILPRPAELSMGEFSFEALKELGSAEIIRAEFDNKRLRSSFTEGELNTAIKGLYRSAKTALEENGANTLYLSLGMLRWFETPRSTKARYAPMILVPIEIVRKSAAQGYIIRMRDEEPQMNITLLEKLKQDFGIVVNGLDPLPTDEHGIDIRRVLTVMRQAVMEQPRWDVVETAGIGIFSFSQFVMWNDIRNRTEDLLRNKVVRSLMDGKLCWDAQPLEIGNRVSEDNVLLPMPADASQLYAIQAACGDESFVLHGPPGTGKSQTITSLIANALAKGKRVLFVAEKMAALEVVQNRLERIGIGPFCLELHSNKSKKKDVLEQLRKASEVTKTLSAEDFAAKAERLAKMRRELDSYAEALHRPLSCGSDLYTLISEYEAYKTAPEIGAFEGDFVRSLSRSDLESRELAVERLIAAAGEIGHPVGHSLSAVGCSQYSQQLRSTLEQRVQIYQNQLVTVAQWARQLCEALEEPLPKGYNDLETLVAKATALACWYQMPSAWAQAAYPPAYFEEVAKLSRHASAANQLEQQLLQRFDPGFLTVDGNGLFAEYAQVSAKWFLPKMLGMNRLAKTLSAYAKSPVAKDDVRLWVTMLRDYRQEQSAAEALLHTYGRELGSLYAGKSTDWGKVQQLSAVAQGSARTLYGLYGSYDVIHKHGGSAGLQDAVLGLKEGFASFTAAKKDFDGLLSIVQKEEENWLQGQISLCRSILEHREVLKEWIAYVAATREATALGLQNIVCNYEQGADHNTVFPSYKKAMLRALISAAIDDSDSLNRFSGAVFNKKIEQYKRLDQEWTALSQQEVYCRLAAKVPNFTREAAQSSELGILQRCIKSGGRGTSIRKLFDQIPNLLPRLCPCMLMSPISAAQYLDPKGEPFDIVVFDEASQLPTCKAVGVLARGKNAIIVGDPKQMPPTAFFATNTTDEDNLDAEDLESILDDCLALNMPQSHLLWHYRSRHESLIAFSNSHFYENKLFTFPSVNDRESKVQLVQVDGVFDRGKSRTNRQEALAVLEEIKRRYADPVLSRQSIGVVTFNISQQHLIDDLLNEACAKDPALEKWAYGSEEPLFIKNLENVQGDERDVILFSIGFGPDENGKIYMNFGPLNRDGGWRRLNVAVSRARCEMMVFSTLRPDQLDLNRSKAEGVAALRSFLEYAQGRPGAIEEISARKPQQSGIAQAVCKALKEKGYDTDLAVGRSEYRIDIGVIDPEQPDRYLLGILLDGPGYGAAKTTRDREIAQSSVLDGLGWELLRLWSMDWWDNSEKELKRILRRLKELQKEKNEPEAPPVAPLPSPEMPRLAAAPRQELSAKLPPVYLAANLPVIAVSPEDFIEPRHAKGIRRAIETVIAQEAPISSALLVKRVVKSYGITRAGARMQAHIQSILEKMPLLATGQLGKIFYWRKDQNPNAFCGFRVNGEGENRRDVGEIPVQEIANAVYTVLYEQVSMGQEDLLRETAFQLGFARLGSNVIPALSLGLRYALEQGGITPGANGALILSAGGTARAEDTIKSFR